MPRLGYLDLCDAARAAIAKGDLAKARKYFEEAIVVKPDSVDAHYGLGTVCYLLRDHDAAWRHFKEVQELDPLHAGAVINLGALCNLKGKYEEAIQYLRKGIQLDRNRSEGYYNLGIAYKKLGRLELAIQAYREAHHLNPRMVEAVYNLANIYVEMDRLEQAVSHYRQAIEINPGFKKAQESLKAVEQRLRAVSAKKPRDSFGVDTPVDDPLEGDERLDRMVDPDLDHEVLQRIHSEANDALTTSTHWLKLSEDLDVAFRNLSIHLNSSSEAGEALSNLRKAMAAFQDVSTRFEGQFETLCKLREKLLEVPS